MQEKKLKRIETLKMVFKTHPFQEVARESDLVPHQRVWLKCLAQFERAERKPGVSQE